MDINKLKEKRQNYYNMINECKMSIIKYNNEINKITNDIQSCCSHEWVTEITLYERDVYCSKCKLTNMEKSRF